MSPSPSSPINALDEGTGTVKLAAFTVSGNGVLTLEHYAIQELGLPPDKTEGRPDAVGIAMPGLLRAARISAPATVAVSLPTPFVFMRHVRLPQADLSQMHEMISLEALQNVPFPIPAAALDYAFTPAARGGEGSEGLIAAVKRQVLDRESKVLTDAGLEPGIVTVAAVALYNSYCYNYDASEDCVLLVKIGAASTELLFIDGPTLFTRVINQAGHFITQNLAKELHESFPSAEELKRKQGIVNLGAAYANPEDHRTARISQSIRLSLIRIANEITKAIQFYQDQRDGAPPKRVFITGGTTRLPYIDVFLSKKLDLPAEFFNPLRNVIVGDDVDLRKLAQDHVCLGELVGVALRQSGPTPMPIALNAAFLPDTEEKEEKEAPPKPAKKATKPKAAKPAKTKPAKPTAPLVPINPAILFSAIGAWALFCVLPAIYNWRQAQIVGQVVTSQENQIGQFSTYQDKLQKKMDEVGQLQGKLIALQKLQTQRDGWLGLFQSLNQSLPKGMWITALNPAIRSNDVDAGPISQIQLRALYFPGDKNQAFNRDIINQFVRNLAQTSWFDVDPNRVSDALVSEPASGNGQIAMDFQLRLKLKKPFNPSQ